MRTLPPRIWDSRRCMTTNHNHYRSPHLRVPRTPSSGVFSARFGGDSSSIAGTTARVRDMTPINFALNRELRLFFPPACNPRRESEGRDSRAFFHLFRVHGLHLDYLIFTLFRSTNRSDIQSATVCSRFVESRKSTADSPARSRIGT